MKRKEQFDLIVCIEQGELMNTQNRWKKQDIQIQMKHARTGRTSERGKTISGNRTYRIDGIKNTDGRCTTNTKQRICKLIECI